ncbi:Crp/Fnr family transcriptional regulator [Marinilabiliaceae bacterium JC017]|nr:Crp/Fnr family transcriptional regulator [Marinilabiliaceae bacterium JC017]
MDILIERIITKATHKRFPKNTILLKAGETADKFVFLKSGITRHFLIDSHGNDITKNFSQGPCFVLYSMSSFLSRTPSDIQLETLSDVELYELDYDSFVEMKSDPQFLELWNNILVNFVIKKEKKEIALLRDDTTRKYLDFLKDFPYLLNKIPHYYIASYLSVSPETLSRIRRKIS